MVLLIAAKLPLCVDLARWRSMTGSQTAASGSTTSEKAVSPNPSYSMARNSLDRF